MVYESKQAALQGLETVTGLTARELGQLYALLIDTEEQKVIDLLNSPIALRGEVLKAYLKNYGSQPEGNSLLSDLLLCTLSKFANWNSIIWERNGHACCMLNLKLALKDIISDQEKPIQFLR